MTTIPLPSALAPAPAGAGPRPLVIGLDLSLTSTGIASHDWADAIRPGKRRGHYRLEWLRREIVERTRAADLIVVEGPSYASTGSSVHQLAGMWWLVVHTLWRRQLPVAVCPPAQRAMYATGRGNASKGEVRTAVNLHFGIECDGPGRYDMADAVSMAALGLHWLGHPLTELPTTHTRALDGVAWPEVIAR